jgi:hypothetical protein
MSSDDDETMVCASRAKGEYGLTEDDLDGLPCTRTRNPHYRNAPSMRLYCLNDVLAAKAKRESPEELEAARRVAEAAREAKAKVRRASAAAAIAAARRHAAATAELAAMPPGTQVAGVPQDVLELIVACLAKKNDGVVGSSRFRETFAARAQDLASASLACRELRAAVLVAGWPELDREAESETPELPRQPALTKSMRALARGDGVDLLKMVDLRALGRALDVPPQLSTKAELADRIRRVGLGLPDGRPMGAAACPFAALAVLHERKTGFWNDRIRLFCGDDTDKVLARSGVAFAPLGPVARNLAAASRALARCFAGADGPARYCAVRREIARELEVNQARRYLETKRRMESMNTKQVKRTGGESTKECACGNSVSAKCSGGRCGRCCDDAACSYHNRSIVPQPFN